MDAYFTDANPTIKANNNIVPAYKLILIVRNVRLPIGAIFFSLKAIIINLTAAAESNAARHSGQFGRHPLAITHFPVHVA